MHSSSLLLFHEWPESILAIFLFFFDVSANVQLRMEESLNLIFNFVLEVCYHVGKCHLFRGI